METALVLRVPEAETTVAEWRLKYDASAARGMPAHITILYPFIPSEDIGADVIATLESVFSSHVAFDIMLRNVKRFPKTDTLWLAPEPPAPVAALTQILQQKFPNYPLYGGVFPEITPHLTVAQCGKELLDGIEADLQEKLKQPIHAHADKVDLFVRDANRWIGRRAFALKRAA